MTTSTLFPLSRHTSATITGYGLYDYLQADPRPTFLIGLSASDKLSQNVDVSRAFFTHQLSSNNVLLDRISRVLGGVFSGEDHDHGESNDFLSWLSGNAQSTIWFCDFLWSAIDIGLEWRIVSGVQLPPVKPPSNFKTDHVGHQQPTVDREATRPHNIHSPSKQPPSDNGQVLRHGSADQKTCHSELLLSLLAEPSAHQRYLQSFNWASTELGSIRTWSDTLYQAVKQALVCPLAIVIHWGPSRNIIWNDAGIEILRGFDGLTPGVSAFQVFKPFWNDSYELVFQEVERTGQSIVLSKSPGPLIERDGGFRETFWSNHYMPMFNDVGAVAGIYGLIHDTTTEVLMEGRIDTLLKVNEAIGTATDLSSFWRVILTELERNAADMPLAAVYSIGSEAMIDRFTGLETRQEPQMSSFVNAQEGMHSVRWWTLEGKIGFPDDHVCVPSKMTFYGEEGLSFMFRQAMEISETEDILLCTEDGTLPPGFLSGCEDRGLGFECTQLVACPLQRPSGGVIAWLVLGINPRRTYDDEYKRFTRLLSRHIESKLVLILTLEREKNLALQGAEEAAQQQLKLSSQIEQQRRELEQSRSRFFNFAEQAPVGVYVLGSQGEVKFANDAWCKIFGFVPGTAVKKAWLPCAHPDDVAELESQWQRCLKGIPGDRITWRVLRPGSTSFDTEDDIIYLEACDFPELADDGTLQSICGVVMDMSVHKAYEREQAEKLTNALEAKRAQEYFMDMVSHEMRNPLNAIIQCAQETSELTKRLTYKTNVKHEMSAVLDDVKDMIDTILYCGAHQKQLIDDVLTLSKLDSNLLVVYPVEVYPATLLTQAVKVFGSEIRSSRVEVSTSLNDSLGGFAIMVDPSRVIQILINLISNAIKFMKGRDKRELHITVSTSLERRAIRDPRYISSGHERTDLTLGAEWGTGEPVYLYFSVRDTGPGLSQSEINLLFTRFKQATPRTHVTYGGSGLGLFISRELTELHGGEIGIISEVGQGSTFVFYVKGRRQISQSGISELNSSPKPATQHRRHGSMDERTIPVTPPTLGSAPPVKSSSAPSLHVLVVEDNDINRRVLKRQLQKVGFQVTTAIHGAEALAILQTSTWWQGDETQEDIKSSKSNNTRPRLSVILCDLEMPVMDGVTCVRQIRQWQQEGLLRAKIPVLAVTGNARAETTLLVAGSDFDQVISKPYTLTSLVEQILAHVDQSILTPG